MDLTRLLTNAECDQSNPITQLASHVTQDQALQGGIRGTSTSELSERNSMTPQSFRMHDLVQEMNQREYQETVGYGASSSTMNYDNKWTTDYQNQSLQTNFQAEQEQIWGGGPSNSSRSVYVENNSSHFRQQSMHFYENPQMTDFYQPVPQAAPFYEPVPQEMYLPYQSNSEDLQPTQELVQHFEMANEVFDKLDSELENKHLEPELKLHQDFLTAILSGHANSELETSTNNDDMHSVYEVETDSECDTDSEDEYEFIENNPMSEISNPLENGKILLAKGNVPNAILCFEAALKQDNTYVEAWKLLGTTWTKDTQHRQAILSLKKGLALESHNLDILMALAERYAKGGRHYRTLLMLLTWLQNHPKYKDIIPKNYKISERYSERNDKFVREEITNMFIQAARLYPIDVDNQIQSALGFLCSLDQENEKATDCFRAALQGRPNDASLWNQLGDSLTDSNKDEEAIDAYNRALDLNPGFVLYHYNLASVYERMANYKKAVEHYLIGLNRQAQWQSDIFFNSTMSKFMWMNLGHCMIQMHRKDLIRAAHDRDLQKLNEEFAVTEF